MAELLVLDPAAVAVNRTEWDITQYVAEGGPDWGDAAIEQYMADSESGSLPVDYRIPNRTVTIPLLLLKSRQGTAYTYDQVRTRFQQKAALFQKEGGWIARTTSIGTVFADVTGATLKFGGSSAQALWGIDADAVLTLTCLPDWYAAELDAGTFTGGAGSTELTFVLSNIKGDYPARTRIKVDELDAALQRGLLWSFRSRNYDASATAAPAYDASALTPYVFGTALDDEGWTSILSTDMAAGGGTPLTHVGSYRVWAHIVPSAEKEGTQVRLLWDIGDLILGVKNVPVDIPRYKEPYLVNLGDVHLKPSPIGTHRWRGIVQARGDRSATVTKIWFQPIDESAGYAAAPMNTAVTLTGYSVYDDLTTGSGNLTGRSIPVGGFWTAMTGSDTDDFTIDTTNKWIQRATASDTAKRLVYSDSPTFTDMVARVDSFLPSGIPTAAVLNSQLVFRFVDANNYAYMGLNWQQDPTAGKAITYWVELVKVVAGATTGFRLAQGLSTGAAGNATLHNPFNIWSTMRVMVTKAGNIAAWWYPQGTKLPDKPIMACTSDAVFATGGALASGKVGFADYYTNAAAVTRLYDNFAAWVPESDAVLFVNGIAELRFDGHYRRVEDNVGYGPASLTVGDLPRLPVAGMEGRSTQVMLKPTSSDMGWVPHAKTSKIKAQVLYRPCYLFVP